MFIDLDNEDLHPDDAADIYKQICNILGALKLVNKVCRGTAQSIPEWWKQEKEYLIENGILEKQAA